MYKLFIDDEREPPDHTWVVVRNVLHAQTTVKNFGLPSFMSLDHDLGGTETTMEFLRWLCDEHFDYGPPEYQVHYANPVGAANMVSYLECWRKAVA